MNLITSQNFKVAITQLFNVIAYQKLDNLFEKNSLTLILLKLYMTFTYVIILVQITK